MRADVSGLHTPARSGPNPPLVGTSNQQNMMMPTVPILVVDKALRATATRCRHAKMRRRKTISKFRPEDKWLRRPHDREPDGADASCATDARPATIDMIVRQYQNPGCLFQETFKLVASMFRSTIFFPTGTGAEALREAQPLARGRCLGSPTITPTKEAQMQVQSSTRGRPTMPSKAGTPRK